MNCGSKEKNNSGLTLIGIIAAIVIMGLLGAGVLMLVSTGSMESIQTLNWGQSFYAAESGVSAARAYMATNGSWRTNSNLPAITGAVGQASFIAILDTNGLITSVGSNNEARWTSIWRPTGYGILVYGTSTDPKGTPRYRLWGGTNWSAPSDAVNVGSTNINWVVVKACPRRDEYIAATIDASRVVKAQVYRGGSWGNLQTIATNPNVASRGVDIACETLSGNAMVVAANGTADPTYYVWNGAAWTGPATLNLSRTNIVNWVKLASDPTNSNEIIVLVQDAATYYSAQVWSNVWGTETLPTLRSSGVGYECMAVEYEATGNQAIIITGAGTNNNDTTISSKWRRWDGTNWSSEGTNRLGDHLEQASLVNDPNSNRLLLTYVDHDISIGRVVWTGSAWRGYLNELDSAGEASASRCVDGAFETIGGHAGHAIVAYGDGATASYRHTTDPTNLTWNAAVGLGGTSDDTATVQVRRTGDGKILIMCFNWTDTCYDFAWYNGTNTSTLQILETEPSVKVTPWKEPFMMAPQRWVLP